MGKLTKIEDRKAGEALAHATEEERLARLQALLVRADKDEKYVGQLRDFLVKNRDLVEQSSGIARTVKVGLLERVVAGQGSRLLVNSEMGGMRKRLSSENPSEAERLLLEAVVLCWLRVQYAETYRTAMMGAGHTFREIEHAERVLTRSYNRYSRALTALARVQKLNTAKGEARLGKSLKALKVLKALSR